MSERNTFDDVAPDSTFGETSYEEATYGERTGSISGAQSGDAWGTQAGQGASTWSTQTEQSGDAWSLQPEQGTSGGGEQAGQGASGAVDQAKQTAGQAVDTAKEKAGQVTDTAKEKAGQMTEQATAKADIGIEKAAGGLDRAADMLRERTQGTEAGGGAVQTVAATAADKLDTAAQYLQGKDTDQLVAELEAVIRRRPVESLLVAAGVGFLLSKSLR